MNTQTKRSQFLVRTLLSILVIVGLVTQSYAKEDGGGTSPGGGDSDEREFKEIAANIHKWINTDEAKKLKLPKTTFANYAEVMNYALSHYRITFKPKPVKVFGEEKTCESKYDRKKIVRIRCNIARFNDSSIEEKYRLIHHEFAGVTKIEKNNRDDSDYSVSDQISGSLRFEEVERLPVGPISSKQSTVVPMAASVLIRRLQDIAKIHYPGVNWISFGRGPVEFADYITIEPGKSPNYPSNCRSSASKIVLKLTSTSDQQTLVELDPDTVIEGYSFIREIMLSHEKAKTTYGTEFSSSLSMIDGGLSLRIGFNASTGDQLQKNFRVGFIRLDFDTRLINVFTYDGEDGGDNSQDTSISIMSQQPGQRAKPLSVECREHDDG